MPPVWVDKDSPISIERAVKRFSSVFKDPPVPRALRSLRRERSLVFWAWGWNQMPPGWDRQRREHQLGSWSHPPLHDVIILL